MESIRQERTGACRAARRTGLVLAVMAVGWATATAVAQLEPADMAALRERGEREGWTFTVDHNAVTHLPLSELCGLVEPPDWRKTARFDPIRVDKSELPARFDWRDVYGVTSVKNQGQCGSCWAFGTLGSVEAVIRISSGQVTDLSEQWLVSCTTAGGCDGGWHTTSYEHLLCEGAMTDPCGGHGAVMEAEFPYAAADLACGCPYSHPHCINEWVAVGELWGTPTVEQIKYAILNYGPVATTVAVDSAFQSYTGGVFNGCGGTDINHLVVLVGWDDSQGDSGVWIMKNSWGLNWGENGYMRIQYNCSEIGYATCYVTYGDPQDCNGNGEPDYKDIGLGLVEDCNHNFIPDDCEIAAEPGLDCNGNGIPDWCDLNAGTSVDCNHNQIPDECDIAHGNALDCNGNGVPDGCDVAAGTSPDCNDNGKPDECDITAGVIGDCNANGIPDDCDLMPNPPILVDTAVPVHGWVEIADSGERLFVSANGVVTATMPFTNDLITSPALRVANDGAIGFNTALILPSENRPIPDGAAFGGGHALFAYWDDLSWQTGGVYTQTVGEAPYRTFIVEWKDRPHTPGNTAINGDEVSFQVQVFETAVDGVYAQVVYADTDFFSIAYNHGASASIGYQRDSLQGHQWSYNQANAVHSGDVLSLQMQPANAADVDTDGKPDECEYWPAGDMNCDEVVDVYDIDAFVAALLSPAQFQAEYGGCPLQNGDMNGDAEVDVYDINPFVDVLTAG